MSTDGRQKALETTLAGLNKRYGDGVVMKLGEATRLNVETIPTGSLSLDIALGVGGLPKGRIIEIYGPESAGKTTVCLHIVREAQLRGGICAFVDMEHALDPSFAARIGVDIENLYISQPDTAEQALEITESLVRSGAIDVVVLDSVGELRFAYHLATVVFVGGSFVPRGGQNILEPAAWGKPVLFGPHMENFQGSVKVLLGRGGIQVADPERLQKVLAGLLECPQEILKLGEMARQAVSSVQGASQACTQAIEHLAEGGRR